MIRGPQVILRTGLLSGAGMEVMERGQKKETGWKMRGMLCLWNNVAGVLVDVHVPGEGCSLADYQERTSRL